MNKKAQQKLSKVIIGAIGGMIGVLLLSYGSFSGQVWITRGGIALMTFAIWLLSWT